MVENAKTSPFLQLVANDLLERFGNNLSEIIVVFPSLRARLFFNHCLYEASGRPLWAPQYISIDELFESVSPYHKADMILLIGELYQSYIEIYNAKSEKPSTETLDEFFFFGEILLNDFDDTDKNLVNANSLFGNLHDLDRLKDDFAHLSENQREALRRIQYFHEAFTGDSSLKTSFWSIWNILGEVYLTFKEKLKAQNTAYPGMLMRDVIEDENRIFPGKQYVFVGFNVLNKCEESLFKKLKEKALFYWDYDSYYGDWEAGKFIQSNKQKFGSALDDSYFKSFLAKEKEITFLASSSESGQSGYIPLWIDSLQKSPDFTTADSAIVLCNEALLPVVIHAIPPAKVENVNITMGFPITQTPIAGFLQALTEMQTKGHTSSGAFQYKQVLQVLRHPYTSLIFPEAKETEQAIMQGNLFFPDIHTLKNKTIFTYAEKTTDLGNYLLTIIECLGKAYKTKSFSENVYEGLYQESIFRAYQVVNRLYGLLLNGKWQLEKLTFLRLLRKLLASTQVPFHGEPVKGLQIMGVLETRTLDFKNLLLLSVNEGFMPGSNDDNTFIPHFLRSYFGMSTIDHQDSIYAYYFYRLIQRAEKITLIYNADKTQTGKAEMSRFLLQMLVDSRLNIRRFTLQSTIQPRQAEALVIPKTEEILRQIKEKYDFQTHSEAKPLTPSNLNTFIDCSLRFYLQKVKGLESPNELSDELDSSIFGTLFHHAAEFLYREIGKTGDEKGFTPFVVQKEHLDAYLLPDSDYRIKKLVSKAFELHYFKGKAVDETQYNGEQLINFRVICKMLKRLIQFDRQRTPFTIIGLEWKDYDFVELENGRIKLKIGGIIDRLEEKDGKIMILDYKTGGSAKPYKTLEDLMVEKDKRASHIFQTFVYASVLIRRKTFDGPIVPALLYMQEAGRENYSPVIEYQTEPIEDFNDLYAEFEELFLKKISDLFNPDIPFQQTAYVTNCTYCEFKELCNR
jgi:CRISPR/Cas system-associated exonuclease Cas4 (RecB family)